MSSPKITFPHRMIIYQKSIERIPEGIRRSDWQIIESVDQYGVKETAWRFGISKVLVYRVLRKHDFIIGVPYKEQQERKRKLMEWRKEHSSVVAHAKNVLPR